MYSFPSLERVHCSTSSINCCFLTCIQISQEAGRVVWYFHLLKNFPQFVVIHPVKSFSIVNEAEVDILLEFSCFFYDPTDVGNLISGSSAFSKPSLNFWKFHFMHYWSLTWRILSTTLLVCEMSAIVRYIERKKMGRVTDFIFLGSKITADGDCSHEVKMLAPWIISYDKPR